MSSDDSHASPSTGDHAHDDHSAGHGHDDHAIATDVIPETSVQDMILKGVTILGAGLIIGTFGWWWAQPYPASVEGHGGAEGINHE